MARTPAKERKPDNVQNEPIARRAAGSATSSQLKLRLDDLKTFEPLTSNQK
jgi:hypothetical protein